MDLPWLGVTSAQFTAWRILIILVVMDQCQYERSCTVRASVSRFGEDPCPATTKYLEVAFKCKPAEFLERITCEGETMSLQCSRGKRIAVHSAQFGRSYRGDVQCPSPGTLLEGECRAACSRDVVVQQCHGRRRCAIESSEDMFGNPCGQGVSKFLFIMYACVPKRILREIDDSENEVGFNSFCNEDVTSENIDQPTNQNTDRGQGGGNDLGSSGRRSTTPAPFTWEYPAYASVRPPRGGGGGATDNIDWDVDRESDLDERLREEMGRGNPDYTEDGSPRRDSSTERDRWPDVERETPGRDRDRGRGDRGRDRGRGTAGDVDTEAGPTVQQLPGGNVATVHPSYDQSRYSSDYIGFVHNWMTTIEFIRANLEKFLLYLILGLFSGLILVLLVIIVRLMHTRTRYSRRAKLDISDPIPSSPHPQEDFTLLESEHDTDGIEILGINHSNSRGPPPFPTGPQLYSNDTAPRGSYDTAPRSYDTAPRSLNNYSSDTAPRSLNYYNG